MVGSPHRVSPRLQQSTLGPWLTTSLMGNDQIEALHALDAESENEDDDDANRSIYMTPSPNESLPPIVPTHPFDPNGVDDGSGTGDQDRQQSPSFFDPQDSPLEFIAHDENIQDLAVSVEDPQTSEEDATAVIPFRDFTRILELSEPFIVRVPSTRFENEDQENRLHEGMSTQQLIALAEDFDERMARIERLQEEIRDVRALYHDLIQDDELEHDQEESDDDPLDPVQYFQLNQARRTSDADLLRHFETHLFHSDHDSESEEEADEETIDPENALYAEYLENYAEALDSLENEYQVHQYPFEAQLIGDNGSNDAEAEDFDWHDFSMPRRETRGMGPEPPPLTRRLSLLLEDDDGEAQRVEMDDIGLDLEGGEEEAFETRGASWSRFRPQSRQARRVQLSPDSPPSRFLNRTQHTTPAFYFDSNGEPWVDYIPDPTLSSRDRRETSLSGRRRHQRSPRALDDTEDEDITDMLGLRTPPFCRIDPNGDLECVIGRPTQNRHHRTPNSAFLPPLFPPDPIASDDNHTDDETSLTALDDNVEVFVLENSESTNDLTKIGRVIRFRTVRQDWRDELGECVGR